MTTTPPGTTPAEIAAVTGNIGTALPVLYSFRRCPYAIRARMALHGAGVIVALREVALRHKPAALLEISPKGTVPVLQLPSGEVIDQSLDIMHWALRQADPQGWLTAGDQDESDRWIALNDGPFKLLLDRYKYAQRHPEFTMVEHRSRAVAALIQPLDARLRQSPRLLGERTALADIALFPFVRQFAGVDPPWFAEQPMEGVQTWLRHFLESAMFKAVMAASPVPPSAPQSVPPQMPQAISQAMPASANL